jgi:hypothetical protein
MTLILELPKDQEAALIAKAQAEGVSADQYVQRLLERELKSQASAAAGTSRRHISETIREIISDVPVEAFEGLPKDVASEHDDYLYGIPQEGFRALFRE